MNDDFMNVLSAFDFGRGAVTFFGLFLSVWLFKLGLNLIVRWFDKT